MLVSILFFEKIADFQDSLQLKGLRETSLWDCCTGPELNRASHQLELFVSALVK